VINDQGNSIYDFMASSLQGFEGNSEQSLFYLDSALKKNATSAYLSTEKAYELARENKLEEASKLATKASALHPTDVDLNILLGKIHSSKKEESQAISSYKKAIDADPSNEEATTLLSREYSTTGQVQEAIRVLKELIEANPNAISAYFYLGSIYATQLKDYPRALAAYEQVLDFDSDNTKAMEIIAEIYLAQKNYSKALENFLKLKEMVPDDLTLRVRVALLYYQMKDLPKALHEFEQILLENPKADRVLYYLGLLETEKGDNNSALRYFGQMPNNSEFYQEAVIRQIVLLRNYNKLDAAIRVVEEAIAQKPLLPDFYDILSSLYSLKKEYPQAISALKQGLSRLPKNESLLFEMAVVTEKSGDWKKSLEVMKQVLEIDAQNASALNFVGYTYAEHGENLAEAEKLIEQAVNLKPNDGYILDSLGWVACQKGDLDHANMLLQKALRMVPREPTILEHLGDVALKKQNKKLARNYYEKALSELNHKKNKEDEDEIQTKQIQNKLGTL